MRSYPVRVQRDSYRGRVARQLAKQAEYNRVAARVEEYINGKLKDAPDNSVNQYLSAYIAMDLKEDSDLVHRVVYSIDCGSNGVTICKGDYKLAMERLGAP